MLQSIIRILLSIPVVLLAYSPISQDIDIAKQEIKRLEIQLKNAKNEKEKRYILNQIDTQKVIINLSIND